MPNKHLFFAALGVAALSNYPVARAQALSEADKPRVAAAISIASIDVLSERCAQAGGFDATQRSELEKWTASQSVNRLRTHLMGPGLSPELQKLARDGAAQVGQQVPKDMGPCKAAVIMTRLASSQFADKLPELLAGGGNAPAAKPTTAAPRAVINTASGQSAKVAADIEGFGFDSCTRVGYGGMVMYVPCPVVLFKNGVALTDVEGLSEPAGLAAHRAANPKKWTQWRRQGDRVQLTKTDGWKSITYTSVYSTLPKNFTLDGRYHSMSGGGNTAMGGGQAVAAWSDYLFRRDGSVQRDGGAGASSTGSGVDVTASGSAASKTGRYRVDGLILAIDYDDGSRERRIIIADPEDQGKGTMWLDGQGYVYKK